MKRISICLIITLCFVQNVVFAQVYGKENGHEWVDLGLPSGTKWATCNVGAKRPEQRGHYFAWGEVMPKSIYSEDTYKYGYNPCVAPNCYSTCFSYCYLITKYNTVSEYGKNGFVDRKKVLKIEDDAAYMNWGGKWRMPTYEQQMELLSQCYWVRTNSYKNSNKEGFIVYKVKSFNDRGKCVYEGKISSSSYTLNDAHIFLPAAEMEGGDSARAVCVNIYGGDSDCNGYYWSSSLSADCPYLALSIEFDSGLSIGFSESYVRRKKLYYYGKSRAYGLSVRAVIPGN